MSKIEVNAIEPQCGTNLTVGASGDTITFPSGTTVVNNGSQTGFGRNGSVNWQTAIKTVTFTAASGEGYFCNTSGGAFTVNLPSSPSVGDIVAIKDYASTFDTQNLTIGRGGSNLNGDAADSVRSTENESLTLVYADATKGWIPVEEGTGFVGTTFMSASGGTITCSGNCRIHTFTGPGTFTVSSVSNVPANNEMSYLVVAGGATGGERNSNNYYGGGGGAGGFREVKTPITPYTASPLDGYGTPANRVTVTAQGYPITVGAGGAKGGGSGVNGSNSVFSTITSTGGGKGGWALSPTNKIDASPGGSGGGYPGWYGGCAGSGNTPPTTPPQGNDGNKPSGPTTPGTPVVSAGGGGGATQVGQAAPTNVIGGTGGAGATTSISATPTAYAGGGGGAGWQSTGGPGGTGGGGAGSSAGSPPSSGTPAVDAIVNTGGGGGGGGADFVPTAGGNGGAASGGSGIVIIRYKFQ